MEPKLRQDELDVCPNQGPISYDPDLVAQRTQARLRLTSRALMAHSTRTCLQPSSLAVGLLDSLTSPQGSYCQWRAQRM